jgi:hypothetical protein
MCTGSLPTEWSGMSRLRFIDLAYNRLTGEVALTFIEYVTGDNVLTMRCLQ